MISKRHARRGVGGDTRSNIRYESTGPYRVKLSRSRRSRHLRHGRVRCRHLLGKGLQVTLTAASAGEALNGTRYDIEVCRWKANILCSSSSLGIRAVRHFDFEMNPRLAGPPVTSVVVLGLGHGHHRGRAGSSPGVFKHAHPGSCMTAVCPVPLSRWHAAFLWWSVCTYCRAKMHVGRATVENTPEICDCKAKLHLDADEWRRGKSLWHTWPMQLSLRGERCQKRCNCCMRCLFRQRHELLHMHHCDRL